MIPMDGRNIFVCGRTGTGKSWLVKRRLLAGVERLIVYCPKREEAEYPGVYFDALNRDGREMEGFWQTWLDCWERGLPYRLVYRPCDPFSADEFDRVATAVYHCGNCTFVAEDLMSYCPPSAQLGSGVKTLLTAGRTKGVQCLMLTQRPYRIPREVTSQAREAFIFASHEPGDVDYVKEAFGVAAAEKMAALHQYEYVRWIETGETEVGKA